MKGKILFLFLMTAMCTQLWAQKSVSGKVTSDEDGSALPGVNVVVVGSQQGSITDVDGNYNVEVPAEASLKFSYIGYVDFNVEVGNQSIIDVVMQGDVTQLSEIVVTALGIERSEKALQYSITTVDGDNFTQARETNLSNALTGRIAGVNVTKTGSGAGGSTRVIIRGSTSLQGNNQPLYVVDGIPMDNSGFGQAGVWGGMDQGDGMTSISPDDIESITVLKGASAAALYGARASNGVINIITKKGHNRKGIGVEFQTNYTFDKVNDLSDLQHQFGSGVYSNGVAVKPSNQTEAYQWGDDSWGPALDGSQVIQFDGVSRPYSYTGSNIDRYYNTGYTWTNSLAFSGGNADQNFRVSFSDLRSEGIIPNTGFDRTNVTVNANSKFGKKLTLGAKVMYSHEDTERGTRITDSPMNPIQSVLRMPPNLNVLDYKGDPNKLGAIPADADPNSLVIWGKIPGEEFQQASNNWGQNPYWAAYQYKDGGVRDRIITSANLKYDITDYLWVQGRVGMDWYTRRNTRITPQGTGYQRGGSISEEERRVRETNVDWMLGYDDQFGTIGIHAFVGGNAMLRSSETLNLSSSGGFSVPFFEAINNSFAKNFGYGFSESGINSLYGSVEVNYNQIIFLTGTVRNDWFSVLNPEVNSILYPSVGLSWVFSDTWEIGDWISFGKARLSFAQVGNFGAINPYSTNLTYSLLQDHLGRPRASFSSAQGRGGNIPNPGVQPNLSTEIEFGFNVRFLNNRLGVDFAYYDQTTTDDILNATIAASSGFSSTTINIGEMTNKGVEVLLTGRPVDAEVTWDISLNFAKNNNEVVSLIEGLDELVFEESRTRTTRIKAIVGEPYGTITGFIQKRDPSGNLIFLDNGSPVRSDGHEILGQGVADFSGGLSNTFRWKGVTLDFLIDFKSGGSIHSGTNVRLTQWGLHKQTLMGRLGQAPLMISGVVDNGNENYTPINRELTPEEAQNYWSSLGNNAQENFTYDASYGKLRQLSLGYTLPRSMLSSTPIQSVSFAFVGRNLAILWDNIENVDPEASYTNSNSQGLDYFGFPATRSYGFNLKVTF